MCLDRPLCATENGEAPTCTRPLPLADRAQPAETPAGVSGRRALNFERQSGLTWYFLNAFASAQNWAEYGTKGATGPAKQCGRNAPNNAASSARRKTTKQAELAPGAARAAAK